MKLTLRTAIAGCLLAVGGASVVVWSSPGAQAQSACIRECRDKGWAFNQCNRYCETRFGEPNFSRTGATRGGARVYGYTSGPGRGTCGQFRYVKDGRCVDARTNPPKL
jgi:hypothetical protein